MRFRLVENNLIESREDQENFINKFGKEAFDFFQKYSQRLKNAKISTDIVWHTKNTSVDDMKSIISDLEKKIVKDKDTGKTKLNRKYIGSGNGYEVWRPLDWETSMNMGDGTGWCITGRYQTDEVKPSQAKQYFNDYTERNIKFYFFMKDGEAQYCIALYPRTAYYLDYMESNAEIWNQEDHNVTYNYKNIDLPYDLIKGLEIYTVEKVDGMEILGHKIIRGYTEEELKVPDGIEIIDDGAFEGNVDLEIVELPESVKDIREEAFRDCYRLSYINIPSKVKRIRYKTFSHCGFNTINIPDNITTIENSAFYNCYGLTTVVLGKGVKYIWSDAFSGCPLENVIYMGTFGEFSEVLQNGGIGSSIFSRKLTPKFQCADQQDTKMNILSNGDIMDAETGEILATETKIG